MNPSKRKNPAAPRVALISGAARGIGLAIAMRLGRAGDHVVLIDVQAAVRDSAAALQDAGASAEAVVLDITREKAVARTVAGIMKKHGRIDVLVNNAGISPKHQGLKLPAERTPLAEWQRVLDINLTGAFLLSRAVIPCMRAGKWGRIINMASQAGRTGSAMAGAHYSASKAGLIGFSRTLALEVAGEGITVNCIAPGMVESELTAVQPAAVRRRYARRMPMGRYGRPAEIAAAVVFLASEDARFITGATIDVNGGTFTG